MLLPPHYIEVVKCGGMTSDVAMVTITITSAIISIGSIGDQNISH